MEIYPLYIGPPYPGPGSGLKGDLNGFWKGDERAF